MFRTLEGAIKIPPLRKNKRKWRPSVTYTIFLGYTRPIVDQTGIIAV